MTVTLGYKTKPNYIHSTKIRQSALTHMAQLVVHHPTRWKVSSSNPSQGFCNEHCNEEECLCSFKLVFWVPLDIFPEVGSLGQKADPFLIFWGIFILLSTVAAPVCIPTNSAPGFPFSTSRPVLVVCWFIDDSHSDRCKMISLCGFNLHFSDN